MPSSNQDLKTLLAQGEVADALEMLVERTEHTGDARLRQRALTLSGQFADLKKQQLDGLLDDKDYWLQRNRIAAAAAEIADNWQLSEASQLPESLKLSGSSRWKKWAVFLALVLFATTAGYFFWKKPAPASAEQPPVVPPQKDTTAVIAPPASKPVEKPATAKNKPAPAKKEVEVKVEGDIKDSKIIIGDGNQIKQNP